MNLLQMAQFVQGNIGTSIDLPFAGPSTIVGATGQYLEFVNYIGQAYKALQLDQDNWRWRIKPMQLWLAAGQNFYTVAQIQAQVSDYEEIQHMHFIDDTLYGLCASHLTLGAPAATTTVGAVTSVDGTYVVTCANINTFAPFDQVTVTDGTNSIVGPVQSAVVLNNTLAFDTAAVTVTGTATSIAASSPVTYTGAFTPPDVGSQTFCFFIEYQNWRGWKDRNVLPLGRPYYYTRCPDGSLQFNPVPDAANSPYIFFNDYRMSLDVLATTSDSSTPATLPARYHEAICWKAIMYWAQVRRKPDTYTAAKLEYDRILNKMYSEQLPQVEPYLREMYG